MSDFLLKLMSNLQKSIDSDISCLIELEKGSFSIVASVAKESSDQIILDTLNSSKIKDAEEIGKLISTVLKFPSSICQSLISGEQKFFIYSASRNQNKFAHIEKSIQLEILKVFELINNYQNIEGKDILGKNDNFHLFAEASNELIFKLNDQGSFNYINQYGTNILRYDKEEIIGKHFYEFISDDYKYKTGEAFQEIISKKISSKFETEILPKVGLELLFQIKLIPLYRDENLCGLLGVGENISEKSAEKNKNNELVSQLKEAKRINAIERDRAKQQISILNELNNLKNEFISNVSHELRTPLASIIGFSETILEDKNLTLERAREFNEIILDESKRLAKLISDVIDFSELENERQRLKKHTINLIEILNELALQFNKECSQKKITLSTSIPDSEVMIYADPERMQKALSYIISNAIKFTNENGRITIMAQEFLKEVEVVITDTGVGISEQKLPILFDKFSKVNRAGKINLPGAGFGLVTVKQIIDLHKGLIRVKSEVDKGTSFIIRLPKYSFN